MDLLTSTTFIERIVQRQHPWSVVSLFAGCGGLDLGFTGGFDYMGQRYGDYGFEILSAYELSPQAVTTYEQNIGNHIVEADLSTYDPSLMPNHDVLIGGFPCQDFSSCGPKRGLDSERGQLYKVFLRVMREHQPKVVVAENVPHILRMQDGAVIETILNDLEAEGYSFQKWVLYAPDYGVPQNRTRVFLVGVRNDLTGAPVMPQATHERNHRSIDWAISDLEEIVDETVPNQQQYFKASKAKNGNGQGDEKSRAGEPSYTIRANAKSRVQFHYKLNRRLTIRECARLQTFPDNFVFPHSATTNIMQIGNAVPPVLANFVAKSVAEYLRTLN